MAFRSFVKQTEVNSVGGIRITVYKQALGPNDEVMAEVPHQIVINPGDDFNTIIAANNAHIAALGFPEIDPAELVLPFAIREVAAQDEKVQERQADAAAQLAQVSVK